MRKPMMAGWLCVGLAITLAAAASASGDPGDPGLAVIELLHEGRFDEAESRLATFEPGRPDPRLAFFRAFVTYWRLLYDDENPELLATLEQRLDRAVGLAEEQLEDRPSETGSTWAGSARLLRAQLYAAQRKPIKAAYEAKRARRHLERGVNSSRARSEAYFGLGTYNYYASRAPALLKGLRFILALPGGDRDLGLAQLDRASRESRYFSLESRILLLTIYSSKAEQRFAEALRQADAAFAAGSDSVAMLHAAAVLDLAVARPRLAARRLDEALGRLELHPGIDPSVIARLRYHRARASLALFRPERALELLRPMLEGSQTVPVSLDRRLHDLAAQAVEWTETPEWYRSDPAPNPPGKRRRRHLDADDIRKLRRALSAAGPALDLEDGGDPGRAASALVALAERDPTDAPLALLAGRALLLTDDGAADALRWLERAARSDDLPAPWVGPCRLLAGRAADRAGLRTRALHHYREALAAPSFIGRDAAHFHATVPYGAPSGTPSHVGG